MITLITEECAPFQIIDCCSFSRNASGQAYLSYVNEKNKRIRDFLFIFQVLFRLQRRIIVGVIFAILFYTCCFGEKQLTCSTKKITNKMLILFMIEISMNKSIAVAGTLYFASALIIELCKTCFWGIYIGFLSIRK